MIDALVSGPFAIYRGCPGPFTLFHVPTQVPLVGVAFQADARECAASLASLDLPWWTCVPQEIRGREMGRAVKILSAWRERSLPLWLS